MEQASSIPQHPGRFQTAAQGPNSPKTTRFAAVVWCCSEWYGSYLQVLSGCVSQVYVPSCQFQHAACRAQALCGWNRKSVISTGMLYIKTGFTKSVSSLEYETIMAFEKGNREVFEFAGVDPRSLLRIQRYRYWLTLAPV